MLRLDNIIRRTTPYPHVIAREILDPPFYDELVRDFPGDEFWSRCDKVMGGRRRVANDERLFFEFVERTPSWMRLYEYVNSPAFAECIFSMFHDGLAASRIDTCDWAFDRHCLERRARSRARDLIERVRDKLMKGMSSPNNLYIHFDISAAHNDYVREIHHDNPDRIAAMLVYFSSASETGGKGGEFKVHRRRSKGPYERFPADEDCETITTLSAAHNLGAIFLNTRDSYHSVSLISGARDWRRFIYVGLTTRSSAAFAT